MTWLNKKNLESIGRAFWCSLGVKRVKPSAVQLQTQQWYWKTHFKCLLNTSANSLVKRKYNRICVCVCRSWNDPKWNNTGVYSVIECDFHFFWDNEMQLKIKRCTKRMWFVATNKFKYKLNRFLIALRAFDWGVFRWLAQNYWAT